MKKIYLLFFLIIALLGCVDNRPRTKLVEKNLPIENFVDTFVSQNPKYYLNDITKEETSKLFEKTVLDTLDKTNLLDGVPLKLEGMNKSGKHTMIHLRAWMTPTNWKYRGNVHEVTVDVISSVGDSLITVLENEKFYRIYGSCIGQLSLGLARKLFGRQITVYNNKIVFKNDDFYDDKINVDLGILYYDIDSIKPFYGRDKMEITY